MIEASRDMEEIERSVIELEEEMTSIKEHDDRLKGFVKLEKKLLTLQVRFDIFDLFVFSIERLVVLTCSIISLFYFHRRGSKPGNSNAAL